MSVSPLFVSEVEVVQVEEVYDAAPEIQTRRRGEAVMIECSPKQSPRSSASGSPRSARAAKPSKAAGASSGAPPATPWSRSVHNGGRHRLSIPSSPSTSPTSAAKVKTGPPADPWQKNKLTSSPRTADASVLSMDTSISADLAAAYTGFSVGDRVIASGLRKREDLNGAQGTIVGFQRTPAGGVAAKVCFGGDLGCAALKTDNLTNAESAEVDRVEEIMVAS